MMVQWRFEIIKKCISYPSIAFSGQYEGKVQLAREIGLSVTSTSTESTQGCIRGALTAHSIRKAMQDGAELPVKLRLWPACLSRRDGQPMSRQLGTAASSQQ